MEFKTPEVKSAAVACCVTENVSSAPDMMCADHTTVCLSRPWARIWGHF